MFIPVHCPMPRTSSNMSASSSSLASSSFCAESLPSVNLAARSCTEDKLVGRMWEDLGKLTVFSFALAQPCGSQCRNIGVKNLVWSGKEC